MSEINDFNWRIYTPTYGHNYVRTLYKYIPPLKKCDRTCALSLSPSQPLL